MSTNISRRDFLRFASAGAGAAAAGGGIWLAASRSDHAGARAATASAGSTPAGGSSRGAASAPDTTGAAATHRAPVGDHGARRLVVIELDGGNDGLSTIVPYGMAGYHDLRTSTAVADGDVLPIDKQVGLHKNLAKLRSHGLAVVQGVGSSSPDESHFEMMRRWWAGDPNGTGAYDTGIFGRIADVIGDPAAPAVALSIGSGSHPALVSKKVSTLALPSADAINYLTGADPGDRLRSAFQRGMAAFGGDGDGVYGWHRRTDRQTVDFAAALHAMGAGSDDQAKGGVEYPGSALGQGLRLAAQLVTQDNGVRIVHVPMGEDFDTHENHTGRHPGLLTDLADAIDAFQRDLQARGAGGNVLVMTTSEFGRRARDNGSGGLDHGTASSALLVGPVRAGLHGEHPSLTSLDDNGNLVATVGLDAYLGAVAEGWLGAPAADLFTTAPARLDALFS